MKTDSTDDLRREIGYLGTILGDTIRDIAGEESYEIVEQLRRSAWDRRVGRDRADEDIKQAIANLDDRQMRVVIRAFTIFLDLANLVEDRRRVQILQHRAEASYPGPRGESIRGAISSLKESGKSPEEVQALIDQLHVDLVFTAHPTDAKRRSVRSKLTKIRQLMQTVGEDSSQQVRDRAERKIRAEIAKLWQTDFIRPWRPSVMQEVSRGLSIKPVLWDEVPRISDELQRGVKENYGDAVHAERSCVTFGSWIGGDRDGHPGVTADVTEETFRWLRREAVQFHLRACDSLYDSLSISDRQVDFDGSLIRAIDAAVQQWPELQPRLDLLPPGEICRRSLVVIRWKLENTLAGISDESAYGSACGLAADVQALVDSVRQLPGKEHHAAELDAWQTQIEAFGLHLARLDIRQNASVYRSVVDEILKSCGLCDSPETLDEATRCKVLSESIGATSLSINLDTASEMVGETVALFQLLHEIAATSSMAAIGTHVISMTSAPSDALTVLWLWELTGPKDNFSAAVQGKSKPTLPIVPLLETIEDLKHGPDILRGMLQIDSYRENVRRLGDRQMIMLGYSDSTKDGGYLAACWSLHQAQQALVAVAKEFNIDLTFFHGRGGSLGRGGGPAARSILSLPRGTFNGHLRLTEQGEVLADRYDDPAIAHRHLEQVVWSSLLAAGDPQQTDSQQFYDTMQTISEVSFKKYRELLEQAGFVDFFRTVTPISEIEQLPIGSRPSRRKPDGGLSDLRAIPWVFSWTQSRCLLPAWYGIGAALGSMVDDPAMLSQLRAMYTQWPFFRALVDNAELALAKSDLEIAGEYASLASRDPAHDTISDMIESEFKQSTRVVLAMTEQEALLDGTPWLKESIRVRNRFIDPLNLIQVELLRRRQNKNADSPDELRHLTRLSINGIAAGMRTSG
ncbi:phosphoenolpyruvate carboxylase [Planctomycetes bacterium K23_9]|uniref:Phosphoenolpyruvate carboxylase n=1 Tax=Stieleria marina TaxID=1930275 RepID=A0A517NVB7_9BACT|nr:Phosphoenolpyruvate carboxylase [Planctomycetes bacterium K23_9]